MQKGQLKGQTHTVGYAVGMQYTVGFSAKRSTKRPKPHSMQYAVGVSAKRSTKMSNPHSGVHSGYAVCSRYAVCVSAKRSTGTVDLANMGGGDHYLWCKKVKPTQWGMQWVCSTQ